ncbi:MAG: hypothetical protein MZU84_04260 [Sphingobacterium sp.]|nr:hypothetical protein [Sphingobacterium sp.]
MRPGVVSESERPSALVERHRVRVAGVVSTIPSTRAGSPAIELTRPASQRHRVVWSADVPGC